MTMPRKPNPGPIRVTNITGSLDIAAGLGPLTLPDEMTMEIGGRVTTWLADTPERRAAGKLAAACRALLATAVSVVENYGGEYPESAARRDAERLRAALAAIDGPGGAEGE
jgi:hypothetical protein